MNFELSAKSYSAALISQCESIELQLAQQGVEKKYLRLLSIQAVYNSFKLLVSSINDVKAQEEVLELFQTDANNLVFKKEPTVPYQGKA